MIFRYNASRRPRRHLKSIFLRRTAARNRYYEKQETKKGAEASEKRSTADRDSDSAVPASG